MQEILGYPSTSNHLSFETISDNPVNKYPAAASIELMRIRTNYEYAIASKFIYSQINRRLMASGVRLIDPTAVYIDHHVTIGRNTIIYPNTTITGSTQIGENCQLGPNTVIDQCDIGDRCRIFASVLEDATMEHDSDIGPFSHLRKGAYVCANAHVGNFGEMKNSTLGPGSKMGHISYLGDTTIGSDVNIGAGTITCNFDGQAKHPTTIGDRAFIGSGTLIVAPIEIGEQAKTGAGAVVTHNIPSEALVYGIPARIKRNDKKNK
ncbi:MAG: DapH/DapD/GlmU-related protein [Anaerolineae bacterium]|nr:DapH/DapD/GlmU-related protein [Anaerolineae bacterium]